MYNVKTMTATVVTIHYTENKINFDNPYSENLHVFVKERWLWQNKDTRAM